MQAGVSFSDGRIWVRRDRQAGRRYDVDASRSATRDCVQHGREIEQECSATITRRRAGRSERGAAVRVIGAKRRRLRIAAVSGGVSGVDAVRGSSAPEIALLLPLSHAPHCRSTLRSAPSHCHIAVWRPARGARVKSWRGMSRRGELHRATRVVSDTRARARGRGGDVVTELSAGHACRRCPARVGFFTWRILVSP